MSDVPNYVAVVISEEERLAAPAIDFGLLGMDAQSAEIV
jgi:hypothetical protein